MALEALFVADLRLELEALRRDTALWREPVRVIVPSQSLRDHLAALCVRQVSPSLAGVSIQTLHGLALSLLERSGQAAPRGAQLFEIVVRRALQTDRALAAELDGSETGPSAAAATLADFLDAGFTSAQAEALRDALGETRRDRPGRSAREPSRALARALSLVSALERTALDMEAHDIARPSASLARAAALLKQDAARSRSRAIWIYGFSDATGLALDLLETLRDRCGARIYVDRLSTAVDGHTQDSAFGQRLEQRLSLSARGVLSEARIPFDCFSAPGAQAEAREVAVRLRALLDRGVRPESIGVVARDLEPWRLALRLQFGRLAIPFSGVSTRGAPSLAERRAQTLATLLQARGEIPIERWLDLCAELSRLANGSAAPIDTAPSIHDLSTACRALGCGRLARWAELDLGSRLGSRTRFVLPVHGPARKDERNDADSEDTVSVDGGNGDHDALPRLERRAIARSVLEALQTRARATMRHLEVWPQRARIARHAAHWSELVREHLGWTQELPGCDAFARAVSRLTEDVPAEFELSGDEFARLARRALAETCASPLGGAGGGVQCLSLVEARARTFDHLFVIALNQGHFPRTVSEDPLLSDELRRRMLPVLPDLPIKSSGRSEERFLFEQLLRASPSLTLSWQSADDDGRPIAVSPLVQRLFAQSAPLSNAGETERAPPIFPRALGALQRSQGALRPAHEAALLAALQSARPADARTNLGHLLPAALREVRASAGLDAGQAGVAAARLAILSEIEAPLREQPALGPYFGFLGAAARAGDLRQADLWVTTLERMAGCPWQAFLERVLRIEPAPDPLALLPAIDARIVGIAVHAVLAEIAARAQRDHETEPGDLARILARPARKMAWPAPAELERLLLDVARRVLSDEGLELPGLERVLIEALRPPLQVARALDDAERQDVEGVLGSESVGSIQIADGAGGTRPLSFKVDRIDRTPSGPRLTDFKTGQPISDKVKPVTREKYFVRAVADGTHLQAAAYALAGGAGAQGRYLFLRPDLAPHLREFAIASGANTFTAEFARATEVLARAWQHGSFFPRLLEPNLEKEPRACARCLVSSACLRGDSGARRRLADWVKGQAADSDADAPAPAESAALELWHLGRKPEPETDEDRA